MAIANRDINKVQANDTPIHDWYRFVLSFPPHLVREYCERFGVDRGSLVLDPFCGTGTVPVECRKQGIPSVGVESHPMSAFASSVKVDWHPDPDGLLKHALSVASEARSLIDAGSYGLGRLTAEELGLLLTDSIGDLALHKALLLRYSLQRNRDNRYARHESLALASAVVRDCSNLHFGPEVGVAPPSRRKRDAKVVEAWISAVEDMADDLRVVGSLPSVPSKIYRADSRCIASILEPASVDVVITSPPYPNEKDYTRTTRLESVILGFIRSKADLRNIKQGLVRSNTRNVYKDDDDDLWVKEHPEIQRIAREIESRRLALGKTSGFERQYHRVAKLYFGGMARHLAELRIVLKPGARLAYVVGDQASYLQVMIRTGELMADLASSLGYEVLGIDLFRTRIATATRRQMREEVVVLRWPGA